jgi:transposase
MEQFKFYGIDVSKDRLYIAQQLDNLSKKTSWRVSVIANDMEAIMAYLPTLPTGSHIVFEATGQYSSRLAYCLSLSNIAFSILNPKQSSSFAEVLQNIHQDDNSDACLLAYYGNRLQPEPNSLESENLHHLQQKRKHLDDLKQQLQANNNRLHALSYDPRASKTVVESLEKVKLTLEAQIELFQQEIFTLKDDELQRITEKIQTIVGIGPKSAHELVIATNGFKDFDKAKKVAKFIGIIPKTKESGSSVKRKSGILKTGQSTLRALLYNAAKSAKRFNRACKELYERLRANGKAHKLAMIAIINKLIRQAFAIVKNDTVFDLKLALAK